MADPSDSTLHLAMRRGDHLLSVGSGVLYERHGRSFIVTAWHNVTGRHSRSFRLLSKKAAIPDNVVVTIPLVINGTASARLPITVPLHDENQARYLIHGDPWPRKDIAVLPVDLEGTHPVEMHLSDGSVRCLDLPLRQRRAPTGLAFDVQPIQKCAGPLRMLEPSNAHRLYPGDDLFVLGYPRGVSDFSMRPIWKRATVASDPYSGWEGQPCFLIDCASRQGMSGAPVVAYSRHGDTRDQQMIRYTGEPTTLLCGIYVGRLRDPEADGADEMFEAQLGTVWKTSVIDEIIDGGRHAPHPDHHFVSTADIDTALEQSWPRECGNDPAHMSRPVVRANVVHKAIAALDANVEPEEVAHRFDLRVASLMGN